MQHNFYPCVLTMAGTILALHFQSFIQRMKSCPITFAFGDSGSGKTTALHCGLGLLGADDLRFFRELTPAKVMQLCSTTNVPLGVDDPDTKGNFSKILIDLYNGAQRGTVCREIQSQSRQLYCHPTLHLWNNRGSQLLAICMYCE